MLRLHDFQCRRCGHLFEALAEGDEKPACLKCGQDTDRLFPIFRINMGPVPIGGYYDDNLQAFVRSDNHRKELMAQQGVTDKGATPKAGPAWA